MPKAAIVDIDGTLVDTNYHHAIAWFRAFRQFERTLPIWQIHRHIGMGGDQLVESLTDASFEKEHGDEVRTAENTLYQQLIDEVQPMAGATQLLKDLKERGCSVILASSAKEHDVERYIELLEAKDIIDGATSSADVEATKPEPDLVQAAIAKAKYDDAIMIGDSTWDCIAATKAGIETIGVLTGGFSREELLDAGAAVVFESVEELRQRLDETSLA
jgi:HAD superfamily hydrolase (TIGR01509 family)